MPFNLDNATDAFPLGILIRACICHRLRAFVSRLKQQPLINLEQNSGQLSANEEEVRPLRKLKNRKIILTNLSGVLSEI